MFRYLPYLLVLGLWIYAFIDCLNTPEERVRGLPKVIWVIVILLFGEVLVGPVAWLVAGKTRTAPADGSPASARPRGPRAHAADEARWVAPDDNPEFLDSLRSGNGSASGKKGDAKDEALLKEWEADLRRREEDLRRRERGEDPKD
ncbi:PLD nuclease N-terminal domain-containing protein [Streptomyces sp. NPDC048664]|uniref:PLD nuclease N-terminal domain-containing protein n=1 Tax=Streptomyces sp. NPDC048664 TaxID=3154505 RepID=UPI00341B081B